VPESAKTNSSREARIVKEPQNFSRGLTQMNTNLIRVIRVIRGNFSVELRLCLPDVSFCVA